MKEMSGLKRKKTKAGKSKRPLEGKLVSDLKHVEKALGQRKRHRSWTCHSLWYDKVVRRPYLCLLRTRTWHNF
jgi:hypothetical protein